MYISIKHIIDIQHRTDIINVNEEIKQLMKNVLYKHTIMLRILFDIGTILSFVLINECWPLAHSSLIRNV